MRAAKKCVECGKEFSPVYGNQQTCSSECQCRRNVRMKKAWTARNKNGGEINSTRKCLECGKEFMPEHLNQQICSPECSYRRKARQKKAYRANGPRIPEKRICMHGRMNPYLRHCHDCGRLTPDYRCPVCWEKYQKEKNDSASEYTELSYAILCDKTNIEMLDMADNEYFPHEQM